MRRSVLCVAALVLAGSVGACRDAIAETFPDGSCVSYREPGTDWLIKSVPCSGPHTHVVLAWIRGDDGRCPEGTNATFEPPDGKLCLRSDPAPTASP
jgi:hypothetical protein